MFSVLLFAKEGFGVKVSRSRSNLVYAKNAEMDLWQKSLIKFIARRLVLENVFVVNTSTEIIWIS